MKYPESPLNLEALLLIDVSSGLSDKAEPIADKLLLYPSVERGLSSERKRDELVALSFASVGKGGDTENGA